jgi:hypothetical protein
METFLIVLTVMLCLAFAFGYSLLNRAGRFTISEPGDLMADHEDIFIKIMTVVGVMEWVCLGLWLFYLSLNRLH